jgi:hydrophobe/amphiphile efflux-1 (HAE1) family protein
MNFGAFAVNRPVMAMVFSIFILVVGILAYFALPIAEYPPIAPPTVVVQTQFPGASAQTVTDTVAAPIEQEVNGVENMLYMYSQTTADGRMTLTVTFKLGTDLDKAQVLVQNRVAIAQPKLPQEVTRIGVTVQKSSPDLLAVVFMLSPDNSYDQVYISNYASRRIRDELLRLDGVGDIQMFGQRDYSMRLWLDPDKIAAFGLTAGDVVAAVRAQNLQIAGGRVAEPPIGTQAFQPNLTFVGRLQDQQQFENIVVKSGANGAVVRIRDIGRVELGAASYVTGAELSGKSTVALAISQRPGSNALATVQNVERTMERLKKEFPPGLEYNIGYNPTEFVSESVHELVKTVFEAIILVILVVVIFLKGWRPAIIPILAIPVSLVGTFAAMAALGLSINNLTLFGLVLAVGIVVDDAIVVVETVERRLEEGESPREATIHAMQEVGGALISITLVLCAVFVPTAFLTGISGQFFRQFAVTIAVATAISCFNSLTLSPALASLILRHKAPTGTATDGGPIMRLGRAFARGFDRTFEWLCDRYAALVERLVAFRGLMLLVYGALMAGAAFLLISTPKGFIPAQDRGYVIVSANLPGAASLNRTTEVTHKIQKIALDVPGVSHVATFSGYSGATRTMAANTAAFFPVFKPWSERLPKGETAGQIIATLRQRLAAEVPEASVLVIPPPPVPGIGTGGGFSMRLQDRDGRGSMVLAAAAADLAAQANRTKGLAAVYTPFSADTPQVFIDIDHARAEMLHVPIERITEAIQTYFGSTYVNDFNTLGRTYQVTAQSDLRFRERAEQLAQMRTRNDQGDMVPLGNVIRIRDASGPDRVARYNLYPAAEVDGSSLPGVSSGTAMKTMAELASKTLPTGIGFEWTDLSYQEQTGGGAGLLVFPLCVLFVYLVLAAQYGSWLLPFSVILIVPMCLLAATLGVIIMGQDINVLTQIGFIVLVGLAAKNAILIVEFAKQQEEEGKARIPALVEACRLRLRAILMTSFAFILGVLPLVISSGAGSEMRRAVGVAVFFGMVGVTVFGLMFTPVFYMLVRGLMDRLGRGREPGHPEAGPEPALAGP